MPMNQKTLRRITSLRNEGLPLKNTFLLIIQMAKNPEDAATAITEIYEMEASRIREIQSSGAKQNSDPKRVGSEKT